MTAAEIHQKNFCAQNFPPAKAINLMGAKLGQQWFDIHCIFVLHKAGDELKKSDGVEVRCSALIYFIGSLKDTQFYVLSSRADPKILFESFQL